MMNYRVICKSVGPDKYELSYGRGRKTLGAALWLADGVWEVEYDCDITQHKTKTEAIASWGAVAAKDYVADSGQCGPVAAGLADDNTDGGFIDEDDDPEPDSPAMPEHKYKMLCDVERDVIRTADREGLVLDRRGIEIAALRMFADQLSIRVLALEAKIEAIKESAR